MRLRAGAPRISIFYVLNKYVVFDWAAHGGWRECVQSNMVEGECFVAWWACGGVYRGVPCFVSGVFDSGCNLVLLCLCVILVVSWVWGGIVWFGCKVPERGRGRWLRGLRMGMLRISCCLDIVCLFIVVDDVVSWWVSVSQLMCVFK